MGVFIGNSVIGNTSPTVHWQYDKWHWQMLVNMNVLPAIKVAWNDKKLSCVWNVSIKTNNRQLRTYLCFNMQNLSQTYHFVGVTLDSVENLVIIKMVNLNTKMIISFDTLYTDQMAHENNMSSNNDDANGVSVTTISIACGVAAAYLCLVRVHKHITNIQTQCRLYAC
jgi:hypothetical protein